MKGLAIALIAVALFSTYAIFGKILLKAMDPFTIIVISHLLASVFLIAILDLRQEIRALIREAKHDRNMIMLISLLTSVIAPTLFFMGLRETSATNSILIGKSEAFIMSILAVFFLKERFTKKQLLGVAVMFAGVAYIATNGLNAGLSLNRGDFLVLISSFAFAAGNILLKKYMGHIRPELIVASVTLFGSLMLFAISLFFMDYSTVGYLLEKEYFNAMVGFVFLSMILGQFLWVKALEMTKVTNVAAAGLASPFMGVFYAIAILGEAVTGPQMVGGVLIILGLSVLEFHFKKVRTHDEHRHHMKLRRGPHV